ncbi:MAG: response regulator [Candidatus Obscuribacterales bacterium]|nr:response regulator [Candidatus Obscuribacterales bacterium]
MTKRILIVEDNRDFANMLSEMLSDDPEFEVKAVIHNEDEVYERFHAGLLDELDCLLLDLHLPKSIGDDSVYSTAGLRILAEARQNYLFNGTIIILTNSRELEDGRRALEYGCDGYLCKFAPLAELPIMIEELKTALRGRAILIAPEMRHVFFRDEISGKEAQLMDMLVANFSWSEIAEKLDYKTAKAAANTGDRIFDKLIPLKEKTELEQSGGKKRDKAMQIWKARKALKHTG